MLEITRLNSTAQINRIINESIKDSLDAYPQLNRFYIKPLAATSDIKFPQSDLGGRLEEREKLLY